MKKLIIFIFLFCISLHIDAEQTHEWEQFLYQLSEDSYKVSLRSKNYVDVSKIAVENGGGGHVRAAGAEIHGELNDIINKLLNRIKQDI